MNKVQKTGSRLPLFIFSVTVALACVLRFFQLLKYTDAKNGYSLNGEMSIALYCLFALVAVFSGIYSKNIKISNKIFELDNGNRAYFLSSAFLCLTFFIDFVHQCYNCYYYVSKTAYIEHTYITILVLSAFLSVLCCFYFGVFSLTALGRNYDFRSFKYFHFAPVMWGFSKLILIMLKIVDIRFNVEACIEFLLVCFMLMFFLCFVSSIDRKGKASRLLVFSSLMTIMLSLVISVPRLLLVITHSWEKLYNAGFTVTTYVAVGAIAFTVLNKAIKYNSGE